MMLSHIIKYAHLFYKLAAGKAAGFIFYCPERDAIFLAKRAKHVDWPLVWGCIGGGMNAGETFLETAKREVKEEAGSLPEIDEILDETIFDDNNFQYKTFLAKVTPETMDEWKPKLNHENADAKWFNINDIPNKIHPGLKWTLKELGF